MIELNDDSTRNVQVVPHGAVRKGIGTLLVEGEGTRLDEGDEFELTLRGERLHCRVTAPPQLVRTTRHFAAAFEVVETPAVQ